MGWPSRTPTDRIPERQRSQLRSGNIWKKIATKNIKYPLKTKDLMWKWLIDIQMVEIRKVVCTGINNIITERNLRTILFESRIFAHIIS